MTANRFVGIVNAWRIAGFILCVCFLFLFIRHSSLLWFLFISCLRIYVDCFCFDAFNKLFIRTTPTTNHTQSAADQSCEWVCEIRKKKNNRRKWKKKERPDTQRSSANSHTYTSLKIECARALISALHTKWFHRRQVYNNNDWI